MILKLWNFAVATRSSFFLLDGLLMILGAVLSKRWQKQSTRGIILSRKKKKKKNIRWLDSLEGGGTAGSLFSVYHKTLSPWNNRMHQWPWLFPEVFKKRERSFCLLPFYIIGVWNLRCASLGRREREEFTVLLTFTSSHYKSPSIAGICLAVLFLLKGSHPRETLENSAT